LDGALKVASFHRPLLSFPSTSPFPFACHKFCSEPGLLYPEAFMPNGGKGQNGENGQKCWDQKLDRTGQYKLT